MMKRCTKCNVDKPISDFSKDRRASDGVLSRCKICECVRVSQYRSTPIGKEKRAAYLRTSRYVEYKSAYDTTRYASHGESYRANAVRISNATKSWINAHKIGPCLDCGKLYPPLCMDLDHVRGIKVRKLASLGTASKRVLEDEIAKCEAVCANCHQVRTALRRQPTKSVRVRNFRTRINALKAISCLDCSETFPPEAMQFDHVRGIKMGSISNMHGSPWGRVQREIDKCEVVCTVCHRLRTEGRRSLSKSSSIASQE
jgi:hypothetical protein